jgi:hypothetical protein
MNPNGFGIMPNQTNRAWPLTLVLAAASAAAGCYDAEALRTKHQESAQVTHMEEIDLGAFQVTLPHVLGSASDSVVEFHAFGHVESTHRDKVQRVLDTRGAELRARMLVSVRTMNDATFDEPKLSTLRHAIADAVNDALEKKLVKKVGFYHFAFNTM